MIIHIYNLYRYKCWHSYTFWKWKASKCGTTIDRRQNCIRNSWSSHRNQRL